MTDPGFPQGGCEPSKGGREHTILPNSPKNCMKLKEFGRQGGVRPSRPPLDPPLNTLWTFISTSMGILPNREFYHGYIKIVFCNK